jgi:hypothetical protein
MSESWSLRYPGVDVEFTNDSGVFLRSYPDIGDPDREVDDKSNARADGLQFGSDFIGGRTVGLSFGVEGSTPDEARGAYERLATIWRADAVRNTPGALAELVSDSGRSAFGRPRRLAPSAFHLMNTPPQIDIEADFAQADDLWYGQEDVVTVPLVLSQGGGLVAPLKSPLVARGYTTRANSFVVLGTKPTWPVITIRGAILNPGVEVAGVCRFAASTSLAYDEWITIDTRPGRRSVLRNGQKIAALSRTSDPLTRAALTPGAHSITLSGSSATGTPTASISWRAAYPTP